MSLSNLNKKEVKKKIEEILIEYSDYVKQELKKFNYQDDKPLIQVKLTEISPNYKEDLKKTEKAIKQLFPNIGELTAISIDRKNNSAMWEMKEDDIDIEGRLALFDVLGKNNIVKLDKAAFIKKFVGTDEKLGNKCWNKLRDSFGEDTKYTNYLLYRNNKDGTKTEITYRVIKKINKKDCLLIGGINLIEKDVQYIINKEKFKNLT